MAERDLAEWDREIEADFQRAVAATRATGKRKRKKEEPWVKVPLWWIARAAKLIRSPATLVLVELLRMKFSTRSSTFTLSNARLRKLGVSREIKRRVLRDLARGQGRLVVVEQEAGKAPRVAEIAAEFVQRKVDVIVTNGPSVTTLKQATAIIPIVFAVAKDPVGGGLVTSLARPGGNVTGQSVQEIDTAGKRIELLREVVPRLRRLAIMVDVGYPSAVLEMGEFQDAARALGIEVVALEIRRGEDIAPAFEALGTQADALFVSQDALTVAHHTRIITLALGARLPTIFSARNFVQAGALMSYGPNFPALFRRAAELVDKILRGAKPGDIPVEQPTKFDLVINLTTAKAIGLEVPPTLLARADEVIE